MADQEVTINVLDMKDKTSSWKGNGVFIGKPVAEEAIHLILEFIMNKFKIDYFVSQWVILRSVNYPSKDAKGNDTTLSGLVIQPTTEPPGPFIQPTKAPISMPLVAYTHATQLMKEYAPSKFSLKHVGDFMEIVIAILYAAHSGCVVTMADYQGMGMDSDVDHPYVCYEPLSTSVCDLLVYTLSKKDKWGLNLKEKLFILGYSEGGYVTMATAKRIQEDSKYSSLPKVTAVAPCAGPHSLSQVMRNLMTRNESFGDGFFLPLTLRGYNAVYGPGDKPGETDMFTLDKSFKQEYRQAYLDASGFIPQEEVNKEMPAIPRDALSNCIINELDNPNSEVNNYFKENDLINWAPQMAMNLFHCPEDDRVPYENSVLAVESFKKQGVDISLTPLFYLPIGSSVHLKAAPVCLLTAMTWLDNFRNREPDKLYPGEYLKVGESLVSPEGKYCLRYQLDGRIGIYSIADTAGSYWINDENPPSGFIHSSDVGEDIAGRATLMHNGKFILKSFSGEERPISAAKGSPQFMQLQDDGTLLIKDTSGNILWQQGPVPHDYSC